MTMYKRPLTAALISGNRQEINKALEPFKDGAGYNYPEILSIPERLPEMAKNAYNDTLGLITVALTKAFQAMNLVRPMNADQIVDLAETILDSSNEDRLALEDVILFLQGLIRGKYGALYESMDIPKFMEKFEVYREARHQALVRIKEERHSNYLAAGDATRWSKEDADREKEANRDAMANYLRNKYNPDAGNV